VKDKPNVGSPFFMAFPSDLFRIETKDVNVNLSTTVAIPVLYTSELGEFLAPIRASPLILHLCTIVYEWPISHPLCLPQKRTPYPLNRRQGGPRRWSEQYVEEKTLFLML